MHLALARQSTLSVWVSVMSVVSSVSHLIFLKYIFIDFNDSVPKKIHTFHPEVIFSPEIQENNMTD